MLAIGGALSRDATRMSSQAKSSSAFNVIVMLPCAVRVKSQYLCTHTPLLPIDNSPDVAEPPLTVEPFTESVHLPSLDTSINQAESL